MPLDFDYKGAIKSGYSETEVQQYLKDKYSFDFDIQGAKKNGYSDDEIAGYIKSWQPKQQPKPKKFEYGTFPQPIDVLKSMKNQVGNPESFEGGRKPEPEQQPDPEHDAKIKGATDYLLSKEATPEAEKAAKKFAIDKMAAKSDALRLMRRNRGESEAQNFDEDIKVLNDEFEKRVYELSNDPVKKLTVLAKAKEKSNPQEAQEINSNLFLVTHREYAKTPEDKKKLYEGAEKVKSGEYKLSGSGQLIKPLGMGEAAVDSWNRKNEAFDRFEKLKDPALAEEVYAKYDKDLATFSPLDPIGIPDGIVNTFIADAAGMPVLPLVAGAVTGIITRNPEAAQLVGAGVGGADFGILAGVGKHEEAYKKAIMEGKSKEEARDIADNQSSIAQAFGTSSGVGMAFVPGAKLSPIVKNSGVINIGKQIVNNIGKEAFQGLQLAGIAAGSKVGENIALNANGENIKVDEGVWDAASGMFMFHMVNQAVMKGFEALGKPLLQKAKVALAKMPKEELEQMQKEDIQQGLYTAEEAAKANEEIDALRPTVESLPTNMKEEATLQAHKVIQKRNELSSKLEVADPALHPSIKERVKALNEEIVALANDKKPREEINDKVGDFFASKEEPVKAEPIKEEVVQPKKEEIVPPTTEAKSADIGKVTETEQGTKEFTTKSGKQKVKLENGELLVKDAKTGEDVSPKTKKKAVLEYVDNHDFTKGSTSIEPPEGIRNESELKSHVIETSNNPYEIAEVYINEEPTTQPLSTKERMVADYGIGKIKESSYAEFGDGNNVGMSKAKTYFSKDGQSLDVIAKEMSDHYGVEIEPSDLIDFIDRFPNGERQALKEVESDISISAANKFKELTGIDINNEIAEKIINKEFNKLSKAQQELAEQNYETAEQLQNEYWNQHEQTNGFTEKSSDSKTKQGEKTKKQVDTIEDFEKELDRIINREEGNPKIAAEYEPSGEVYDKNEFRDIHNVLSNIRKEYNGDPLIQRTVDFLEPILKKNKNIKIDVDAKVVSGVEGWAKSDGTIQLNFDEIPNRNILYRTALHEMIHTVTVNEIAKNEAFRGELENVLSDVRAALGVENNETLLRQKGFQLANESKYGVTNPMEMLAEVFTNAKFHEYLKGVEYKGRNLVEHIIEKIVAFFSKEYGVVFKAKSKVQADNVADFVIQLTENLIGGKKGEIGRHPEVEKLEARRDAEISKLMKPEVKMELVSVDDLINAKDPIAAKEAHTEIKEKYKQIRNLIDCLWAIM